MEAGQQDQAARTSPSPNLATDGVAPDAGKVIDKLAAGGKPSPEEADAALAWLLADSEEADEGLTLAKSINVGTSDVEHWIDWVIKPVDTEVLRALQQQGNRAARRSGGLPVDVQEYELRVVAHGTVSPDLDQAVRAKGAMQAPDPMYARMQIVAHRFRNKPGLITQLASAIMDLSGFDDADMRDSKLVKAAKN